ncbi:hypothetical protein DOY81_002244 [Sarcophaga bullata]|nr:hypothetical protein DOY81_002244 [Sarcophaga bullata]
MDFQDTPMDLVIVSFLSRVSRILQMPRGNILMVGMGGSGRRSSCRLAAHIADCRLMTVQVTKTYTQQDWRDDLKKILMTAGFNLNHTVFLFSDSQQNPVLYSEQTLVLVVDADAGDDDDEDADAGDDDEDDEDI